MWSKPFVLPIKTSLGLKEVAVLLMDTQGMFDLESAVKHSATVFALSDMISSVQVFSVTSGLRDYYMHVLQLYSEYGRLAIGVKEQVPFQSLMFLIRDWLFPDEYEYGLKEGKKLLEKKLKTNGNLQWQRVNEDIRSFFKKVSCFLMPYPGNIVAMNKSFDGRLTSIDDDFLEQLEALMPLLVSPEKLVVKKISGSEVTGRQFLEYFSVHQCLHRRNHACNQELVRGDCSGQ